MTTNIPLNGSLPQQCEIEMVTQTITETNNADSDVGDDATDFGSKYNIQLVERINLYQKAYDLDSDLDDDDNKFESNKKRVKIYRKAREMRLIPARNSTPKPEPVTWKADEVELLSSLSRVVALVNLMTPDEYHVTKLNTRLFEALGRDDIEQITRLLATGANPNATCGHELISACHLAAMNRSNSLSLLVEAGGDCFMMDGHGRTPLHIAAWAGNVDHINFILKCQKNLQSTALKTVPTINQECTGNGIPLGEDVLDKPCEGITSAECVLPKDRQLSMEHVCKDIENRLPVMVAGWTALHAASARAQHSCVEVLLSAGADHAALDLDNRTPLDVVGVTLYDDYANLNMNEYKQTVTILLKAGGKLYSATGEKRKHGNSPLHTAVELGSEESLEVLLKAGASVRCLNSTGLTVMHLCVRKHLKDCLQLLVHHDESNVEATDIQGYTVLHAAIKENWSYGVCIALQAGASITAMAIDGNAPIHDAVSLDEIDIIKEIFLVAKKHDVIDFPNENLYSPLFVAVSRNKLDVCKLLIKFGAKVDLVLIDYVNVFHLASQLGHARILNCLLYHDRSTTENLINISDLKTEYTPLVYAIVNNHLNCVRLLLKAGKNLHLTKVVYKDDILNTEIVTTPLHIAVSKDNLDIVRYILYIDSEAIHRTNSLGLYPLHEACYRRNKKMIALLLNEGADLSRHVNHLYDTYTRNRYYIEILMNNLSKPTEFMENVFDSCISTHGMSLHDTHCKVTVNYNILAPNATGDNQMAVIKALVNTGNSYGQKKLIQHPLIESFLFLKWRALLPYFYFMIAIYAMFVISLNVYVVTGFYKEDNNKRTETNGTGSQYNTATYYLGSDAWKYMLYVSMFLVTFQEMIFIRIRNNRVYIRFLETWVKVGSIGFSILLLASISWPVKDGENSPEWARLIATLAVLLSWVEFMYILSRFPTYGFYVLMFGKVAQKVFKILLTFIFLIFGFSLCFMIQFRAMPPFEDLWAAITKTVVMMTSEYDYTSTVNAETADQMAASIVILRLIFITFVLLASIVVMNLIVGVAVNDVNYLEEVGKQNRLHKQVDFLVTLEGIVCHKDIQKLVPKKIKSILSRHKRVHDCIVLKPRSASCPYNKILPNHIREAIFEKVLLQQKQIDEKQGSMAYKMKLDEIHDAIIRQESMNLDEPDQNTNYDVFHETVKKLNKEIEGLRNEMNVMKILISKHSFKS